MTLAEFLLARIAEDETEARPNIVTSPGRARRMQAECEGKRRIVTLMGYVRESFSAQNGGPGRLLWDDVNRREKSHAYEVLIQLALPYASHPDYDERWKP